MKTLLIFFSVFFLKANEWQVISNDGPEARYINQLASAGNSLILFGGKNSNNNGFDDLWEWKEGKWNSLGTGAGKRWDHSYTYMTNEDQLFLFGGRTFKNIQGNEERVDLNDNWVYKNNQWKKLTIESPNPRSSHSLAFNQKENQVILFGGRNKDEIFDDTWSFNGQSWTKLDVNGPKKRYGHTLTYDPISKMVYLFGGFNGKNLLNDLWAYNGENWIEIQTEIRPSPRMAHAMQFDNKGNAVLVGGWADSNAVSDELWVWSNGKWSISITENTPQARLSGAIGYDSTHDQFILFGGSTGFDGKFLSETWKLSLVKK